MRDYMTSMLWFNIGKYGAIAVLAGVFWLTRQRWWPHHHTGYVSINGYVHACSRCGRLPAGAVRAGFYGADPDSPAARRYDALKAAEEFRTAQTGE